MSFHCCKKPWGETLLSLLKASDQIHDYITIFALQQNLKRMAKLEIVGLLRTSSRRLSHAQANCSLSEQLRQFVELFGSCFSKRQWTYFHRTTGALECEERKTVTGVLRVVGGRVSLSGFSRFPNKWPWSSEQVAQVVQRAICAFRPALSTTAQGVLPEKRLRAGKTAVLEQRGDGRG
jgi:hypothetical protein